MSHVSTRSIAHDTLKPRQVLLKECFKQTLDLDSFPHCFSHRAVFTCDEATEFANHHFDSSTSIFSKNLFLQGKVNKKTRQKVLLVAEENAPTNLKALAKLLRYQGLRFDSDESMWDVLKVTPGSVTILSLFPSLCESAAQFAQLQREHSTTSEQGTITLYSSDDWNRMNQELVLVLDHKLYNAPDNRQLVFHPLINEQSTALSSTLFRKFVHHCNVKRKVIVDFKEQTIVKEL
mmetsp:Transcript_8345/g.30834  ORF Transcript_8345/g.30834 Transcript_8345/m.30834 type:complete len:234 (-) Transcript_8345:1021-1722(-)